MVEPIKNPDAIEYGPWEVKLRGWGDKWYGASYSTLSKTFIVNGPSSYQDEYSLVDIMERRLYDPTR